MIEILKMKMTKLPLRPIHGNTQCPIRVMFRCAHLRMQWAQQRNSFCPASHSPKQCKANIFKILILVDYWIKCIPWLHHQWMVQAMVMGRLLIAILNCMDCTFSIHPWPRQPLIQLQMDTHRHDLQPKHKMCQLFIDQIKGQIVEK